VGVLGWLLLSKQLSQVLPNFPSLDDIKVFQSANTKRAVRKSPCLGQFLIDMIRGPGHRFASHQDLKAQLTHATVGQIQGFYTFCCEDGLLEARKVFRMN
jgi:hypothetical protein